jgi:Tfp pilus assembly protein PilF
MAVWAGALALAAWAVPRTLDVDFARVAQAYREHDAALNELLQTAIARHPANDHLELVAAEDALRRRDPKALHHLNRALRLHPANGQAHYLAARTLIGMGHRSQAALEYRMARERGVETSVDELLSVLGDQVVDAHPQRTDDLMRLAHELARRGKALDADAACQRAVQLAALAPPALIERVEVAMQANDGRTLTAAAHALMEAQPEPEAAVVALKALAQTGKTDAVEEALLQAVKLHPDSSMLVLAGAELRFTRGDLPGARALLKHAGDGSYSLADRLHAEELLAKIADKEGDVDGAVLARARARLIAHKLDDTSAMP